MAAAVPIPSVQPEVPADEHVFLIGRPPISEYLGFVEQTIEGQAGDKSAFMDRWRTANDHIRELEEREAGLADAPPVRPLPDHLGGLGQNVLNDPISNAAFGTLPIELGMVELDRLVVFQKHVNLSYVGELRHVIPDDASDEDIFAFALPVDRRYDPPVQMGRIAQNAWVFTSPSRDFRPLQPMILDPRQVTGLQSTGAPVAIVALLVGYGSNYLSAIRIGDRLVLNNGSHRAYALRDAGHTQAPCLIQTVSRREELELVGSEELRAHPERYLDAARPPVLRDYFDPALRLTGSLPRSNVQVRVVIDTEKSIAPGA